MTGDRRLKPHEMRVFLEHGSIGLNTVKELLFTGGEPTLFEVAFLELIAKVEAHTQILINQGAEIKVLGSKILARDEMLKIVDRLELAIKMLNTRLNESDENLKEVKKLMTDQIAELRKILWEMEHDD